MVLKRVGILYHPMVGTTRAKAEELETFLVSKGVSVWACSAWEGDKARAQLDKTDLILSTGGDGTILRAAQVALPNQTPIVGINMGKLGFLTELRAEEAIEKLPELLEGKGWLDERAMLEAELLSAEADCKPSRIFHALNDVVLARGAIARVININTSIDGEHFTAYKADGVIVATATGSTGYSLAVGGPILYPQSEDFLLVPIAGHLAMDYSLVLLSKATVKLYITTAHQATLSVDGHINVPVASGATIIVRHSPIKTRFLRIHPQSYFYSSLEQRLKGKTNWVQ